MENAFTGHSRPPLSCGKAKYLVVLIHGFGSSADEIIDLSMDWAPTLNKAEFLAPVIPWQSEGNSLPSELRVDLTRRLQEYLDSALEKKHLEDAQLALVGFAEGASLAIAAGLERTTPLCAIVAIGHGLKELPETPVQFGNKTPALLVTAEIGPASPAVGWLEVRKWLEGLNTEVDELQARGDYFGLDDPGVIEIAGYLRGHLVKTDAETCD